MIDIENIKHLVVSGCSQTADGIGGCPPVGSFDGGCSFVDQENDTDVIPNTWAGFLSQDLKVKSLINLAAGGHGNAYISQTLIEFLTCYQYPIKNTMVIFNISEPGRMDFPCSFQHPDVCSAIPYDKDMIPYSWIRRRSTTQTILEKNVGLENAGKLSRISLISLFAFLENHDYQYRFITMNDYADDSDIGDLLKQNKNRIDLNPGKGIVEFGKSLKQMKDLTHPNSQAHRLIAKQILSNLHKHDPSAQ